MKRSTGIGAEKQHAELDYVKRASVPHPILKLHARSQSATVAGTTNAST